MVTSPPFCAGKRLVRDRMERGRLTDKGVAIAADRLLGARRATVNVPGASVPNETADRASVDSESSEDDIGHWVARLGIGHC